MKRLNFEHLTTEKSSMNRVDPFFILILVLLSGLAVTYKAAQYDLSGLRLQILVNDQLRHKIKVLELKQKELQISQNLRRQQRPQVSAQRGLASLPSVAIELDPIRLAENLYNEAVTDCLKKKKDLVCVDKIESVITQFPDTKWAGESLVLLTYVYFKNKKHEQAKELIQVVRGEFKQYPDLIKKINEIEKQNL